MAFATKEDVAARLGRDLTEGEETQVVLLLEGAQVVIEEAVERGESAIVAAKGAVPRVLCFLAIEKVVRAMGNPQGLSSQSEALGAYSHTERFNATATTELALSVIETLMARRAVHGGLSGTAEVASLLTPADCGS